MSSDVAWIGLGANLGDRRAALRRMVQTLRGDGFAVDESPAWWTSAVGVTRQPDFLNQVLRVRAPHPLSAAAWLDECKRVQELAGRRYTYRWGPRRADADLLLLGEDGSLRHPADPAVPHPELAQRPFLSGLLARLDPNLRHPDGWSFAEREGKFAKR